MEKTSFRIRGNASGATLISDRNARRPCIDFEGSAIAKDEPSVDCGIEPSAIESSFAVFQTAVVQGLNSINESKAEPLDMAMICRDSPQQENAEMNLFNCEDEGFCQSEYLCEASQIEPLHGTNVVQNDFLGTEREVVPNDRAASSHEFISNDIPVKKSSPVSAASENSVFNPTIARVQCASESPENAVTGIQSDVTQNQVAKPTNQTKSIRGRRKRNRVPTSKDRQDSDHKEGEYRIGGEVSVLLF